MNDTVSLHFTGFHPSEWTQSYLQTKISRLHDVAPYGSVLRASFHRKGNIFKGVIQINSSAGKFFAKSKGRKLKEVCNHLSDQLITQLGKWKTTRFHGKSIRHEYEYYDRETDQSSA